MDHTKSFADRIEETLIAGILGVMTVITFANVVMRYVFNQNILWALELTVFLFGWLVLLPFLGVLFVFLILVTYVPWISTFLPNTFMGPEIITK